MAALRNLRQGGRIGRNGNNSGIWTSLHKAALLLQRTPHTQDFHTLPSFDRLKYPLQPGNSPSRQSPGRYDLVLRGESAKRIVFRKAINCVYKSLVCLALHQDDKAIQGTEYKIGVKILNGESEATYEGLLLHHGLCSNIALIKIVPRNPLRAVATFGKLELMHEGELVVAAGCEPRYSSWHSTAGPAYDVGRVSHVDIVMGNDEEVKNKESNDAMTTGRLLKARFDNGRDCIGRTLVSSCGGVIGVIHNASCIVEATPIDDVLACLEKFEKNGERAEDLVRA